MWFILGLLFGYYIIAPLAINFLGNYSVSEEISNIIDVGSYMSTVLSVTFAAAIAFQLPLLIRLLASIGLITSETMRQYRKVAVAALLIFAAIITPPDVVSQVLIFIPCYALYEYGITIAHGIEVRRAKEEAEYEAMQAAEAAAEAQTDAEAASDAATTAEAESKAEAEGETAQADNDKENVDDEKAGDNK